MMGHLARHTATQCGGGAAGSSPSPAFAQAFDRIVTADSTAF